MTLLVSASPLAAAWHWHCRTHQSGSSWMLQGALRALQRIQGLSSDEQVIWSHGANGASERVCGEGSENIQTHVHRCTPQSRGVVSSVLCTFVCAFRQRRRVLAVRGSGGMDGGNEWGGKPSERERAEQRGHATRRDRMGCRRSGTRLAAATNTPRNAGSVQGQTVAAVRRGAGKGQAGSHPWCFIVVRSIVVLHEGPPNALHAPH